MAQYDIKIAKGDGTSKILIDRVSDYEVASVTRFAKKPIVNKDTPTIDDDAWENDSREYFFNGYVTTANMKLLQTRKELHEEIRIFEENDVGSDVKIDDGWITKLHFQWRGAENWFFPWFMSITIISNEKA